MPRPPKCRRVEFIPRYTYFKPAGVPLRILEEICLSVDELEAIRLKDLKGLEQEICAERMNISRPTFHRVLSAARVKIADALIGGKAIRVEGGNFQVAVRSFRCLECSCEWETPFGIVRSGTGLICPGCKSDNVRRSDKDQEDCDSSGFPGEGK